MTDAISPGPMSSTFMPFVLAMASAQDGSSAWMAIVPWVLIFGIFYFVLLLPAKRKQQKVQQFLDALKVNDKVITTGGIYGQITKLSEQSVQIQIADKVRIEVSRAAIGGYQGQPPVVDAQSSAS